MRRPVRWLRSRRATERRHAVRLPGQARDQRPGTVEAARQRRQSGRAAARSRRLRRSISGASPHLDSRWYALPKRRATKRRPVSICASAVSVPPTSASPGARSTAGTLWAAVVPRHAASGDAWSADRLRPQQGRGGEEAGHGSTGRESMIGTGERPPHRCRAASVASWNSWLSSVTTSVRCAT